MGRANAAEDGHKPVEMQSGVQKGGAQMEEIKVTDTQRTNAEKAAAILAQLSEKESKLVALASEAYMSGFLAGMTARTA